MAVIFRYIWGPVRELATSRTTRSREGMTAMEALRVQNDALRVEMQRLEIENARFRDEHPDESTRMEAEARAQVECERLTSRSRSITPLVRAIDRGFAGRAYADGRSNGRTGGSAAERY